MKKVVLCSFVLCVFMFSMCRNTGKDLQVQDEDVAIPAEDSSQTLRLKNSVKKDTELRVKVDTFETEYSYYDSDKSYRKWTEIDVTLINETDDEYLTWVSRIPINDTVSVKRSLRYTMSAPAKDFNMWLLMGEDVIYMSRLRAMEFFVKRIKPSEKFTYVIVNPSGNKGGKFIDRIVWLQRNAIGDDDWYPLSKVFYEYDARERLAILL